MVLTNKEGLWEKKMLCQKKRDKKRGAVLKIMTKRKKSAPFADQK